MKLKYMTFSYCKTSSLKENINKKARQLTNELKNFKKLHVFVILVFVNRILFAFLT